MNDKGFVHLRVHSEYSVIDGLVRVKALAGKTAELEMPAVAITDHVNLYALIKFYTAANQAGIKPICGCDVLVADDDNPENFSILVLLTRNLVGYKNLIELISRAHLEGQFRGNPYIKRSWLKDKSDGLIALSGGRAGEIGKAILNQDIALAEQSLTELTTIFPESFYLELQRTSRPGEEEYIQEAVALAEKFNVPVVATNDVRFLNRDEFEAHEARVCINERRTLDDPRRPRVYSEEQYLRTAEEMQELFRDIPEALENTVEIARRCTLSLELGKPYLPNYPIPDGLTVAEFMRQESENGLKQRLETTFDREADDFAEITKKYQARLDFELDIISQMGFPGYFLIVMEFIQWAKNNDIPVGPGRGSGAGSLVAYVLKITDLDPLAYDLLFERFLNPERVSMPDFDVDFCMEGRDRVIEHVAELYGQEAVSQIITFGTMAAKAVIRDVGRVQGKSYGLADKLSKLVPFEVGMTLQKALEQEKQLVELIETDEEAEEIMEMAFKLEGVIRNVGKHAGGVVIAPTKLTDFSPLYCDESGGNLVTQYDKNDVESAGLVKFDFLGLRTLTIIDWAVKMINGANIRPLGSARGPEQSESDQLVQPVVDINFIPLDDPAVYKMLEQGDTTAIFQLESRGMKDLIKRLKPSNFEDIIALVALFRPGPLGSGMVDDFINRKHGRMSVSYPHPDLEPVLKNTYGVILYQEQVMQIAQVLADYTLGGADMLRRAMGKKKPQEMQEQRQIFLAGSANKGIDSRQADTIFDLMEKFADYGFNKSHSAAYALVSYQTAWLKYYYPAHFMAAVLSADMQNTDKIVILIEECRRMEIPIISPDVNSGRFSFTVDGQGRIIYGLGAIKGLGEGTIENIIAVREESGPFTNLFDFCNRINMSVLNKRAIEALIRSGAIDSFGADRAVLLASMSEAVKTAEQSDRTEASGVADMFGDLVPDDNAGDIYSNYRNVRPWSEQRRLQEEKDSLGLYLSGHPIEEYLPEIQLMTKNRIVNLKADKSTQMVIGLIHDMRIIKSKRGDTIAILTLDDRSARIEVSLFGEVYESCRELLSKDIVVFVEGVVNIDEYSGNSQLQIRARKLISFKDARQEYVRNITLNLHQENLPVESLQILQGILAEYGPSAHGSNSKSPFGNGVNHNTNPDNAHDNTCDVVVNYSRQGVTGSILLGKQWRVHVEDELLHKLREQYGANQINVNYR
ncbi:DNA polymerase III subunit alpha [Gammaproteobacteria bacterium]|nr:DNA polymerase III subunit alpha [Gammaproteobacteria bacterium]